MKGAREIVRAFIQDTFAIGPTGVRVEENTSFIETGLIDSMGVLELVDFLESQFRIAVEDFELVPENLDSISSSHILDRSASMSFHSSSKLYSLSTGCSL